MHLFFFMYSKRHSSRIITIQALYVDEFNHRYGFSTFEKSDSKNIIIENEKDNSIVTYALLLYAGVKENKAQIDELIKKYSINRSIENITIVELSILRLAFYSMLYDKETHPNVIITESVKLSNELSNEVSFRFINGLLDKYVKDNGGENVTNNKK